MPIDLYTWTTPNGRKASICLEEMELDYEVYPVNINRDEQFAPDFLAISPNNRIPAIVDTEGPGSVPIALFESGAILIYLAEKTGRFLSEDAETRYQTLQWLMWQMGNFGPMLGQAHHFLRFARQEIPYARKRYGDEARRLYKVLDTRLAESEYLAGDYSIADIATFPWAARHEWHQIDLLEFENVKRWYDAIAARPAVVRGMNVPG